MKLLCTSDWQCSSSNLHRCELMLGHLLKVARKEKVGAVLHLGDIKDAFNPVDQRVQNFMVRATKLIRRIAPFHVLLGNHDRIAVNDEADSCMPVLQAAGAFTYEVPTWVQFAPKVWIYMVPYFRDRKVLLDYLRNANSALDLVGEQLNTPRNQKLLAFHAELDGCKISSRGSTFASNTGIPSEGLWSDDYALCLGGHIHCQQRCGDNIWYVGSPFQQDWGEANNPCGFLLVTMRPDAAPTVKQIASRVPGYWDPKLEGFCSTAPAESQLRIQVDCPADSDPGALLSTARKAAEEKYPRFHIHVVPVVYGAEHLRVFDQANAAGDEELIQRYLDQTKTEEPEAVSSCILYYLRKRGLGVTGLERLRFLKVTAENVLCYEKCEVLLAGTGITLVTGENRDWGEEELRSNGSGKSSALSLPLIALFGRTPKGQMADSWARQGCHDGSQVTLSLLLADGRTVEITRCRPAGLEFRVAGKLVGAGDARGTQRAIEQLLRLTWDVATNALYIGQKEVGTILSGTDKERKELFSRFLGLDRFLMVQEDLRAARRQTETALRKVENEIEVTRGQIEQIQRTLATTAQPTSAEMCVKKLADLRKRGVALANRCAWEIKLSNVMDTKLEHEEAHYRTLDRNAATAAAVYRGANKTCQDLKILSSQKTCPTCGTELTAAHMRELLTTATSAAETARRHQIQTLKTANTAEEHLQQSRVQRQRLASALVAIQRKHQVVCVGEAAWQERLKAAQESAARAAQQQSELQRMVVNHGRLDAYRSQLSDHIRFLDRCLAVVGREGLPAYLCGAICPALNAAALRFSELFTGGALGVAFTFADGELDIQVENQQGGAGLNDQSQGEMRMVGLVAAFALRDVLVPYNLLILDEPGEGLDAVNAKVFAKGLSEAAEWFGSLFVVTHNTHILAALEPSRRLHAIKENQISRLEELV